MQRMSNDLEEVYNLIIEGKGNTEIANAVPVTFMRYHKGITAITSIVTGKQIGRASCRERVSSPV